MLRQVPERKQHATQESQLARYMQEFMKGLYDGENTAPVVVLLLLCDSFYVFSSARTAWRHLTVSNLLNCVLYLLKSYPESRHRDGSRV